MLRASQGSSGKVFTGASLLTWVADRALGRVGWRSDDAGCGRGSPGARHLPVGPAAREEWPANPRNETPTFAPTSLTDLKIARMVR